MALNPTEIEEEFADIKRRLDAIEAAEPGDSGGLAARVTAIEEFMGSRQTVHFYEGTGSDGLPPPDDPEVVKEGHMALVLESGGFFRRLDNAWVRLKNFYMYG